MYRTSEEGGWWWKPPLLFDGECDFFTRGGRALCSLGLWVRPKRVDIEMVEVCVVCCLLARSLCRFTLLDVGMIGALLSFRLPVLLCCGIQQYLRCALLNLCFFPRDIARLAPHGSKESGSAYLCRLDVASLVVES